MSFTRMFLTLAMGGVSLVPAWGDPAALPTLALTPAPPPTVWSGLTIGSELSVLSGKGAKGHVGGAGFAGYEHQFANNLVIGAAVTSGYAPAWGANSPFNGVDYTIGRVRLGYDMGRFVPFVSTSVALAKPHLGPNAGYTGAGDAVNSLFRGNVSPRGSASVGAGFDYAVTNNVSVGIGVSVGNGPALAPP